MAASGRIQGKGKADITIHPIAGRQRFFRVPERIGEECDLTIQTVRRVVGELGNPPEVSIRIRPWINYLPQALLRGGWHPSVVTINGKRFSRGAVPDAMPLHGAITRYLLRKGATG